MTENGLKKPIIGPTDHMVKVTEKPTWRAERGQNANAKNGLTLDFSTTMSNRVKVCKPET